METSQQQQQQQLLSIESFSYSWLAASLKPSLESLLDAAAAADESAASSYIEMDPRMPPSKRFFRSYSSHEFNFDFPADHSPPTMNHADELFADGYVVPFFLRKAASHRNHDDDDVTSNSVTSSPDSTGSTAGDGPVRSGVKTRRRSSLRRVLEKYLELIGPLLGKLSGRRSGGPWNRRTLSSRSEGTVMDSSNTNKKKRVITSSNNKLAMRRWLSSGQRSPRVSAAYSEEGWRRSASSSCDSESSIREAVLHCKRSFGK